MEPEIGAYLEAIHHSSRRQEKDVAEMQASVDEVARVRQLVTRLPEKVRHKAMIPYGKHAFFPGELIHTNEFLVSLGCDLQLEASAVQAAALLQRRQDRAAAAVAQARRQLEEMRARVQDMQATLSNEEGEAFMEIRQDYEESEELLRSARSRTAALEATTASSSGLGAGLEGSAEPGGKAAGALEAASAARPSIAARGLMPPGVQEREGHELPGREPAEPAASASGARTGGAAGPGPRSGGVSRGGGDCAGASAGPERNAVGAQDEEEDDLRIFARLAELERLEAEAEAGTGPGSGGDEDDRDAAPRGAGRSGGQDGQEGEGQRRGASGSETSSSTEAAPAVPRGNLPKEGGAAGGDGKAAVPAAGVEQAVGAGPKAASQKKAGAVKAEAPFKKGFLIGGGSAGKKQTKAANQGDPGGKAVACSSSASAAAAKSKPTIAASTAIPSWAVGASSGSSTLSSCSTPPVEVPSEPAGGRRTLKDSEARAGEPAGEAPGTDGTAATQGGRRRRVSFADGSMPGMDEPGCVSFESTEDSQRRTPSPPCQPVAGASTNGGLKPALKQGTSRLRAPDAVAAGGGAALEQAGMERGTFGATGAMHRDVERTAVLEAAADDVAMQMARAREAAFTGTVHERVLDDGPEGEWAGIGPASDGVGRREEVPAQPKRVSKFKQQRMGSR